MKSLASKVYEGEPLIGADLIAAYIAFKHITTNLIDFWNCYIREDRVLIPTTCNSGLYRSIQCLWR